MVCGRESPHSLGNLCTGLTRVRPVDASEVPLGPVDQFLGPFTTFKDEQRPPQICQKLASQGRILFCFNLVQPDACFAHLETRLVVALLGISAFQVDPGFVQFGCDIHPLVRIDEVVEFSHHLLQVFDPLLKSVPVGAGVVDLAYGGGDLLPKFVDCDRIHATTGAHPPDVGVGLGDFAIDPIRLGGLCRHPGVQVRIPRHSRGSPPSLFQEWR